MRRIVLGACLTLLGLGQAFGQQSPSVFVNELHNEPGQADEWTEIVVAQDNLDMRGFFLGDNNNSTGAWRAKKELRNVPFWQHMRAGTYIIVRHTPPNGNCTSQDTDASDGFLDLCVNDDRYFDGGDGTTLFLSSDGDFVHIVDRTGRMIQGMGFDNNPGSSVEGGSCNDFRPNQYRSNSTESGARPCGLFLFLRETLDNSASLFYTDSSLANLVRSTGTFVSSAGPTELLNAGASTLGLGNTPRNVLLMRRLRQPSWTPQQVCVERAQGINRITFTVINDPYPTDGTLRYVVVRYTSLPDALATPPQDGVTYSVGQALGSGTVAGLIAGTGATGIFTDNPTAPENAHYRIYAQRYTEPGGRTTSADRGPAYNEDNFVSASPALPLVVTGPASLCPGDTAVFTTNYVQQLTLEFSASSTGLGLIPDGATVKVFLTGSLPNNTPVTLKARVPFAGPCVGEGEAVFTIRQPVLTLAGDSVIDFGDTATIRVTQGVGTYTVTPSLLTQTNDSTFLYGDTVSRRFTITREDLGTCRATAEWNVRVNPRPIPPVNLFVPNLVIKSSTLPRNKTFLIQGATVDHLQVFNRWGGRVVDALGYGNDWAGASGTYFFMADLTLQNGDKRTEKGWVEVID